MITYDVHTDLPMELLTEVAKETFRLWLDFSLGHDTDVIGEGLKSPSGRYAAALSWKPTGPNQVTVMVDEDIAPEARRVEEGTKGADMKQMLARKFKISASGEAYRVIPIRPDNPEGPLQFDMNKIVRGPGGKGQKMAASVGKIWATPRPYVHGESHYVTMRESSPGWQVPPMPAYAPALALKQWLENEIG